MGILTPGLAIGVDGGGTKTDAVALTLDGAIVGRRRGPGSSPHFEGLAASVGVVDDLVRGVAGDAPIAQVNLYLSGLDLPVEIAQYRDAVTPFEWASRSVVVDNDLFALLRAGTEEPDAVAVVCGSGVNAVGVRADGETVRFPSLGALSGDWGGGSGLGPEALWHAARDVDGRGPETMLTMLLLEHLGAASIPVLIEELHFERRPYSELFGIVPAIFDAAAAGDAVAGMLVERQADEVVAYVRAIVTRLGFADRDVPIVLGGSILAAGHALLDDRIAAGVRDLAPHARIVRLSAPPLVGAALAALAHAGAAPAALVRARAALIDA
ncbi:N-acetylglucosamine kinase [Microbacterium sp. NPDC058389]|uniref:N-acetylglucosamine kinase n=1 Tax=Microbacterium sp. NPDC058389 TaxID=3346475 RepID=UPI00365260C3